MKDYKEYYINEVMENLGDMMEYAVYDLDFIAKEFFLLFINSSIAKEIERENPKYTVGMSGVELAREVVFECFDKRENKEPTYFIDKSDIYWAGWILAYYQYKSQLSYVKIHENITFDNVLKLYPTLHEADIKKSVEVLNQVYECSIKKNGSALARIRKSQKLTQKELATKSNVSLRMIQLYEQGQNDISKARVDTLIRLANVMNCDIGELID